MNIRVGVFDPRVLHIPWMMKRGLLYFDEICITHLDTEGLRIGPPEVHDLYEYLGEQDWCHIIPHPRSIEPLMDDLLIRTWGSLDAAHAALPVFGISRFAVQMYQRLAVRMLEDSADSPLIAVRTAGTPEELYPVFSAPSAKEHCLSLVLEQFPVVDDDVPLEDVIEFRTDSEMRTKRAALLRWQNALCRETQDPREMADEYEAVTAEYKAALTKLDKRVKLATVETALRVPLEILEHLIRLQPSRAIGTLFEMARRKGDVDELKSNLPGREVAYIFDATKRFPSS